MVQYKKIINSICSFRAAFITLCLLGFIYAVSTFIANLLLTTPLFVAFFVAVLIAIVGTYQVTSPLLIDYEGTLLKLVNKLQNSERNAKSMQANFEAMQADFEMLEAIYDKLQATAKQTENSNKQSAQITSELQNELSECKATHQNEIAAYKQQLNKANDFINGMQSELKQSRLRLNELQATEKFKFLVELGLNPDQVRKGLTNTINGLQNGKSPEQKQQIIHILNTV